MEMHAGVSKHIPTISISYGKHLCNNFLFHRQERKIRYAPKKAGNYVQKRIKGRVAKTEDYNSVTIDVTRSY